MTPDTLDILVSLSAHGEPPTEFRLFSKGDVKTRKGAFLFDDVAAASVMSHASEFAAEYPLDYGHAMLGGGALGHADPAEGHKAAGWFRPEVRGGELWATGVTWTPMATRKLKDREYRYISPAFRSEDVQLDAGTRARRVVELINVALTNVPATKGLTPIMASTTHDDAGTTPVEEIRMSTVSLSILAATMGAPLTSEADAITAVKAQRAAVEALSTATGKTSAREALGVVLAWKEQAARGAEAVAKLDALESAARKQAVEKKIQDKVDAKCLPPNLGAYARKTFADNVEGLDAFLAEFGTPMVAGPEGQPVPAPVDHALSGLEMPSEEYLSRASIKPEEFQRRQKELRAKGVI